MSRLKKGGAVAALAVTLIGGFEGLRTTAYRDSVGIPTICYGETRGVRMGMHLTKPQCDAMLVKRLDQFADGMERCIKRPADSVPPDVYVAFLSLSYNIGTGGFCRSSVVRAYNAGDDAAACEALRRYDRAGGRVLPGLDHRRKAEEHLCLKGAAQ